MQNLDRRLGYQMDSRFYGTDFYLDEIERRLASMTVEDVNRAVREHLDRWDLRVAIVAANASELAAAIENNGESPVVYQTEGTAEEVLAEDVDNRGARPPHRECHGGPGIRDVRALAPSSG